MNKNALVGKIFLLVAFAAAILILIVLVTGTIRLNLGKGVSLDVNYNPEEANADGVEIIELPSASPPQDEIIEIPENETNSTEMENNNSFNSTDS